MKREVVVTINKGWAAAVEGVQVIKELGSIPGAGARERGLAVYHAVGTFGQVGRWPPQPLPTHQDYCQRVMMIKSS